MRRVLLGIVTSALLLTGLAVPASACINDREVETSEREFKSDYLDRTRYSPGKTEREVVSPAGNRVIPYAALGLGVGLLIGAVMVRMISAWERPGPRSLRPGPPEPPRDQALFRRDPWSG